MKIFFDANVILDTLDAKRTFHLYSLKAFKYCLLNEFEIFTSCDVITTIYYINAKIDKSHALLNLQNLIQLLKIIEFSNQEINDASTLMLTDANFTDLEDTLQYILAKKRNCDLILSNDRKFKSMDIPIITSEEFCKKFIESN